MLNFAGMTNLIFEQKKQSLIYWCAFLQIVYAQTLKDRSAASEEPKKVTAKSVPPLSGFLWEKNIFSSSQPSPQTGTPLCVEKKISWLHANLFIPFRTTNAIWVPSFVFAYTFVFIYILSENSAISNYAIKAQWKKNLTKKIS